MSGLVFDSQNQLPIKYVLNKLKSQPVNHFLGINLSILLLFFLAFGEIN